MTDRKSGIEVLWQWGRGHVAGHNISYVPLGLGSRLMDLQDVTKL